MVQTSCDIVKAFGGELSVLTKGGWYAENIIELALNLHIAGV